MIVDVYQVDSPDGMRWEYYDPDKGVVRGDEIGVEILDLMARGYQIEIHPWPEEGEQ